MALSSMAPVAVDDRSIDRRGAGDADGFGDAADLQGERDRRADRGAPRCSRAVERAEPGHFDVDLGTVQASGTARRIGPPHR